MAAAQMSEMVRVVSCFGKRVPSAMKERSRFFWLGWLGFADFKSYQMHLPKAFSLFPPTLGKYALEALSISAMPPRPRFLIFKVTWSLPRRWLQTAFRFLIQCFISAALLQDSASSHSHVTG